MASVTKELHELLLTFEKYLALLKKQIEELDKRKEDLEPGVQQSEGSTVAALLSGSINSIEQILSKLSS